MEIEFKDRYEIDKKKPEVIDTKKRIKELLQEEKELQKESERLRKELDNLPDKESKRISEKGSKAWKLTRKEHEISYRLAKNELEFIKLKGLDTLTPKGKQIVKDLEWKIKNYEKHYPEFKKIIEPIKPVEIIQKRTTKTPGDVRWNASEYSLTKEGKKLLKSNKEFKDWYEQFNKKIFHKLLDNHLKMEQYNQIYNIYKQ